MCNYASVRMRTAAYGSLFVCVCMYVCVCVCVCITALTAQRLKFEYKSFYRLLAMLSWVLIREFAK